MADNLKTIDTVDPRPFKKLIMTIGELPTSFLESMTYYEMLAWFVDYLQNTIIPAVNNNAEALKELQKAFIDLKKYVDDYFKNLDVQEEINNKLDEMAEDGTLQEIITAYIQANVTWTFDTVADMKTATNLVDGSYAQTLGYRNLNDGGGSIYKIVDNDELIDDGGSIIELDSGLKASLIVTNTIRIAQFGIDGNHGTNIDNFVTYINNHNLINTVEFEPGVAYPLDVEMAFNKKDLFIKGNGASIKISDTTGEKYIFRVTATNSCVVNNIIIDGSEMPQNQWNTEVYADMCLRTPFAITSPTIEITNVRIKDVWGKGVQLYGYDNVLIKDCVMDKIGGDFWYTDAQTSLFDFTGDGIYLSGHTNDANVLIENCTIVGYENTDTTKNNSRCGIVFENLAGYTMTNKITNLKVVNSIFKNFSRFLHHENYSSLTHMSYDNCEMINCVCGISDNKDYTYLKLKNCVISFDDRNVTYLGTAGIRYFNGLIEDSTITVSSGTNSKLCMDSNLIYRNCTINNIHGLINENAYGFVLENTILNFKDNYTGSYISSSSRKGSTFKNCIFNKTTQTVSNSLTDGALTEMYGCTFNNVFPAMKPYFVDNNTKIYLTSEPTGFAALKRMNWASASIYINNVLVSKPNINTTLPQNAYASGCRGYSTAYITPNLSYLPFNGSTLPLIPATLPENIVIKNNTKYLMIMYASTDIAQLFANNFSNVYYTDLTFNASGVASVGTINTRGTISTANQITFDTDNNTALCTTNNSRYFVWILPYEYKYMLGL